MNELDTVLYRTEGEVAVITLNRPKARNSLNSKMREQMYRAVAQANNDSRVRVVLIEGEGKSFCAGADLVEQYSDADQEGFITQQLRTEYHPILLAIGESKKPYLCALNGAAAGIGAAIAMACDLVVMAEDAFIYSAFGAIGLLPDGGTHWMLSKHLGNKKAFEMIAESQRLDAVQCERLALINRVVSAENLSQEALDWAQSLTAQAPLTLQYSKQLLREVSSLSLAQSMEREAQLQDIPYRSEDFKEGAQAFLEKRAPKFIGQ
jgi:2-(1,2-epoxy-1,2-dihydrophenyl)acetyl-CoA isomerase